MLMEESKGRKEWTEYLNINPRTAASWLDKYSFHGQRPVSKAKVLEYTGKMQRGEWQLRTEIVLHHLGDSGIIKLSDGQHRLSAIVQSGVPIKVSVHHIVVKDETQIGIDYAAIDIGYRRSDFARYSATDAVEQCGLTATQFRHFVPAIGPVIGGFTLSSFHKRAANNYSFDGGRQLLIDWAPCAQAYFAAIKGAESNTYIALKRMSCVSMGLITFRHQPEIAEEFWNGIALNDGLRRGDPRRTILQFLIGNKAQGDYGAQHARAIASAWNNCYRKRDLLIIRGIDAGEPINILGTPYDGKAIYEIEVK